MTTAVIVQARMGSTRFPAKVLADLAGKPVLAHVLERCRRIKGVDSLRLAIPSTEENFKIVVAFHKMVDDVILSHEHDVLSRYVAAVNSRNDTPDVIVRITADCPMIDPDICGQVIALRRKTGAAYASNVHPRSFPQGLDCEVFTVDALERANERAVNAYEREHVTPYMVRTERRANLAKEGPCFSDLRWTLDYPEDLEFMRAVFAVREPQGMQDVLDVLRDYPEIAAINAMRAVA